MLKGKLSFRKANFSTKWERENSMNIKNNNMKRYTDDIEC